MMHSRFGVKSAIVTGKSYLRRPSWSCGRSSGIVCRRPERSPSWGCSRHVGPVRTTALETSGTFDWKTRHDVIKEHGQVLVVKRGRIIKMTSWKERFRFSSSVDKFLSNLFLRFRSDTRRCEADSMTWLVETLQRPTGIVCQTNYPATLINTPLSRPTMHYQHGAS